MYTDAMARAFHSLADHAPRNFKLTVVDNDNFLTVKANEKQFFSLNYEDKLMAVEYMVRVKKALEDNGAIVLLVREGGEDL
jgi:hypothetical protein